MPYSTVSNYNRGLYNRTLYNGGKFSTVPATATIIYNDYPLQDEEIITEAADDLNPPQREFVLANVTRDHGQKLQDSYDREKDIAVRGAVVMDSNQSFLNKIDEIKKYLRPNGKLLKITEGDRTRVYQAQVKNMPTIFTPRKHFNIDWIDFDITFVCYEPFGRDESRTVNSLFSQTANTINTSYYNAGIVRANFVFSMLFDSASSVSEVQVTNNTNGESIRVTRAFSAGEFLKIDGEKGKVTVNGVEVRSTGYPTKLDVGPNSYTITITSSSHEANISGKFYNYYS